MKIDLEECFSIIISSMIVIILWQWLEIIFLGETVINKVDIIISFILGCSLYNNLKFYIKR